MGCLGWAVKGREGLEWAWGCEGLKASGGGVRRGSRGVGGGHRGSGDVCVWGQKAWKRGYRCRRDRGTGGLGGTGDTGGLWMREGG